MSPDRFLERKADVKQAVSRLEEAVIQPETDLIRDAVIQRFEFSFESVWKALKLYIEHQGFECGGPRATLKKAFDLGLIDSAEDADVWLGMLDDRNSISHTYDQALAQAIYQRIVQNYSALLTKMASIIDKLQCE